MSELSVAKQMKRAGRRRQDRNRKARAFQHIKLRRAHARLLGLAPSEISAADVGRLAQTPAPCSCLFCGNPRRHYKGRKRSSMTFQEKREFLKERHHE
jgi:hypothetical protein